MSVLGFVTGHSSNSRRLSVLVESSWRGIDKQSSTSADDVFQQLSIRQIQELHNEYTLNIEIAKKEIHQLVGSKYRDLIGIAEDIDRMHNMSSSLDTDIADISYQKSTFVSFLTEDGITKFALDRRVKKASEARQSTQALIAKNLITNTLILFDLLPNKSRIPPDVVVFYAKFYHLMEMVFGELFESDLAVQVFYELKQNFRLYLELQLSSYFSGYSTNVERSMELRSLFLSNEVVSSNLEFSQQEYEERDDFDDELDDLEDDFTTSEDPERSNSTFPLINDLYVEQTRTTSAYFKSLSPIENYLSGYIILNKLNPELNSLSKVLDSFILLRYNFLASLFADVSAITNDHKHVNFARILHFIQDTIKFKNQFFGTNSSSFRLTLLACTKPWSASDVLGFRNWFEQEQIVFEYSIDSSSSSSDIEMYVTQFGDLLYEFVLGLIKDDSSTRPVANVTLICRIFLSGIKRLDKSLENESNYSALDMINDQEIPQRVIKCAIEKLSKVFESHFNTLVAVNNSKSSKSSISELLRSGGKKKPSVKHQRLFSKELYALNEENTNSYIKTIRELSKPHVNDAVEDLNNWFSDFSNSVSVLELMKSEYYTLSITTLISQEIDQLRSSLHKEYWSRIGLMISYFQTDFEAASDIKTWYYIIGIVIQVETHAFNADLQEDINSTKKRDEIRTLLKEILTKLVDEVPKACKEQWDLVRKSGEVGNVETEAESEAGKELEAEAEAESEKEARTEEAEKADTSGGKEAEDTDTSGSKSQDKSQSIPSRPSFEMTSFFYKVATEFLKTSETQHFGYGGIFQQPSIHDVFIGLKDDWLCKLASETNSSTLQGFADRLYILQFVSDDDKITSFKKNPAFTSSEVESTSRNIEEYFASNEYLFTPILMKISK